MALVGALITSTAQAVVVNVARIGTASQSSTRTGAAFQGDIAQVALDGNTDGIFNNGSVTHTNNQAQATWLVDLNADRAIDDVVLFNRADCCGNRLSNFNVAVLNDANAVIASQNFAGQVAQGGSQTFNFGGVTGQRVRVQLNGANVLSLAEVQVFSDISENDPDFFGNGRNVARLGTATQSSTRTGAPQGNKAILAIDGNTNGVFGNQSVTHTDNEATPSWMVELTDNFHIDNIILHERTDGCCNNRLNNFNISVLDENMNEVFTKTLPAGVPTPNFHAVDFGTEGKFVKVQLNDNGNNRTLELAEVQVFGGELPNIARNPKAFAFQSSTRIGNPANPGGNDAFFAIDGITDGRFFGDPDDPTDGSVTHTAGGDPNPTWNLLLGGQFNIDEIVIFNRAEVSERLSNAEVALLFGGDVVFTETLGNMAGVSSVRIDAGNIDADALRIMSANGNILSLAEVQVFGTPVPEPATFALIGASGLIFIRRRRRTA